MSYSDDDAGGPEPQSTADLNQQLFADLELESVMAYRNPVKMAACLRSLAKPDPAEQKPMLQKWGEQLSTFSKWGRIAAKMPLPAECLDTDESEALVRLVIARIATAATNMATAGALSDEQRKKNVYDRMPAVLDALANVILKTNPSTTQDAQDSPALALRGGAANGAYSAGFLFELLSLRERALPPEGDNGKYKFSAIVGTSVGSLIAQILDLYFVDPKSPIQSQAQQALLKECIDYWNPTKRAPSCMSDIDYTRSNPSEKSCFSGWPNYPGSTTPESNALEDDHALTGLDAATRADLFARRPLQMTALTKLYQAFTDNGEQNLMCVEPGPVFRVMGWLGTPSQNLMRFDPMAKTVIAPVLDAFSAEMIANDVPRVVVAVELQNNQVLGLDDRMCANMHSMPTIGASQEGVGGREYCLGAAVMASSVIPAYARPVRHLYDGITPLGSCGSWFDGGLRSVFPAYRALRMTRPAVEGIIDNFKKRRLRVLAVGTGPLEGQKQPRRSDILSTTLDSIGQSTSQNDLDEVMMARQMAMVREEELCEIMQNMTPPPETDPCAGPDPISDDVSVSAVYVPAETPPYIVAGAEYSFDRTLMRGLWVWGRHVAIQRVLGKALLKGTPRLFDRLGWHELQKKAVEFAKLDEQTLRPWLEVYSAQTECASHRTARAKAGQRRISECVPDCAKITKNDPTIAQYFVCPKGENGK